MSEGLRELRLVAAIALVALLGLALEAVSGPIEVFDEVPVGDRHVERGTFCPPPIGQPVKAQAAIATASGASVPIDFQDASTSATGEPAPPKSSTVAEGAFLLHNSDESALTTIGFGDRPIAGALNSWEKPAQGAGAGLCSERPSDTWWFPVGTSELRFGEQLLLFNPYPDEAVAQITFFDETGANTPGSLTDVAVPSGGWTTVSVNQFVKTEKLLSARVQSTRGRVIAWRAVFQKPEEQAKGVTFTLGAPQASPTWYFPHGLLGGEASQKFTIVNPSQEEATVSITTFSSAIEFRQAVDLTEIRLEPETSRQIDLASAGPLIDDDEAPAHLSATVTTCRQTNPSEDCRGGVPIVVERSIGVESGVYEGVATEVGASQLGSRWMLPPVAHTATDDSLALFNAGRETAEVEVTLVTLEGRESPPSLASLKLDPGRRLEKSLDEYSELAPFFAVVESTSPIVAERMARSVTGADLTDSMGRVLGSEE